MNANANAGKSWRRHPNLISRLYVALVAFDYMGYHYCSALCAQLVLEYVQRKEEGLLTRSYSQVQTAIVTTLVVRSVTPTPGGISD